MDVLHDLSEALKVVASLPFYASLPIYLIGYGVGIWIVAKALKAVRDLFK